MTGERAIANALRARAGSSSRRVIEIVSEHQPHLVFCVGRPCPGQAKLIDATKHLVLTSGIVAVSAYRGFLGCGPSADE